MKKYVIETWGCQMNSQDSEKIAGVLHLNGYLKAEGPEDADLIVLNTCSIREKAEQKFLSRLGRMKALKQTKPGLMVAVAGCIAQQMGSEIFRRAPHVDFIIGTENIHKLGSMDSPGVPNLAISTNPALAVEELPSVREEQGRAWVSIMYGCDNFCAYCIVPYTRGRERSRPSKSILAEISGLAQDGVREVTLLGQNVNSYRSDTDFTGLLGMVDKVGGIERVRFVTSHPRDFSDELIGAMAGLKSVCEHVHLPLQSGSDRVLRLMNRGYTIEEYLNKVTRLRELLPGVAITTDLIAGFPGETPEDHAQTIIAMKRAGFDGAFAFKFSRRPGTKAAGMEGQLPEAVKLQRLKEILALQDEMTLKRNNALVGGCMEIMVEGPSPDDPTGLQGRTRTNKIVHFRGRYRPGELVSLEITGALKHSLKSMPRHEGFSSSGHL